MRILSCGWGTVPADALSSKGVPQQAVRVRRRVQHLIDNPDDYVTGHHLDPVEPPDDLKPADDGWD
jgi:hypothetical protein